MLTRATSSLPLLNYKTVLITQNIRIPTVLLIPLRQLQKAPQLLFMSLLLGIWWCSPSNRTTASGPASLMSAHSRRCTLRSWRWERIARSACLRCSSRLLCKRRIAEVETCHVDHDGLLRCCNMPTVDGLGCALVLANVSQ